MRFRTLDAADEIYEVATQLTLRRVPVDNDQVSRYWAALRALNLSLGESRFDEYWLARLKPLRRRQFAIHATPLPCYEPALELLATVTVARRSFEDCASIYPEFEPVARDACDALLDVFALAGDPLGSTVSEVLRQAPDRRLAVVLANHGYQSLVQIHLRRLSGTQVDVVSPLILSEGRPYDLLIVVGAPSWYARYGAGWIFTSPRAGEVVLVGFRPHATEAIPPSRTFSHSRSGTSQKFESHLDGGQAAAWVPDPAAESDWSWIPADAERRRAAASPADLVDARLCILGTGVATFLPASDEARIQTLDLDLPPGRRLVSLPPSEIGPGTFVLLRIEGGGDLIVIVADAILGEAAASLREMQRTWKARLRDRVHSLGVDAAAKRLREHGSKIADRGNVTNWCSPRSLRTESRDDFDAIMSFVGLQAESDRHWNAMAELDSAHRKAGFAIRQRLDTLADHVDSAMLDESGRTDFHLAEGGGTLAALRVEAISPMPLQVASDQLGELFDSRIQ